MDEKQQDKGVRSTEPLPEEIKQSEHYIRTTQWGKRIEPGSHAAQQRDFKP